MHGVHVKEQSKLIKEERPDGDEQLGSHATVLTRGVDLAVDGALHFGALGQKASGDRESRC